jgi:hypothetical protein
LQKFFGEQYTRAAVQRMLPNPSVSNFPAPPFSWSDVARVCRRVCVLRERGLNEEAERLRAGELMEMVATVRTPGDNDTDVTERLNHLFATEAERVANAAVLAELLLPQISARLNAVTTPTAASKTPTAAVGVPARAEKPAQRSGSIADFIDDMIAQDKPTDRSGPGAQRRAS